MQYKRKGKKVQTISSEREKEKINKERDVNGTHGAAKEKREMH